MDHLVQHTLAVSIAVTGATCTALATAVQQRVARRTPRRGGLQLVVELARSRAWSFSWAGLVCGYGCYLVALSMAPLTLIQPILLVGLALGSVFAARLARRRPDRRLLTGCLLCVLGLSVLLLAARPVPGTYFPVPDRAPAGFAAVLGVALVVSVLVGLRWPAWGFAAATGALWGTTAALAKLVLAQLALGWTEPFGQWPLYAMLVVAPLGFVLSQRAFQLSPLLAPVNAVISVLDPIVATSVGVLVLGERTAPGPAALLLQGAAAIVTLTGVAVVARRSARLARLADGASGPAPAWG